MTVLMEGIVFGESPRWHDGRVWFSDWGAHQVIALDPEGRSEVIVSVPSFPMCIDFLPDGRLLVVDSARRRLLRREPDGSMVTHADLAPFSLKPWNEVVVDADGNAYVNNTGYDFPGGEPAPGSVVLVTAAGAVRTVAGDLAFPNGMAITADGGTLVVAESHASRLTAFDIGPDGGLGDAGSGPTPPATTRTGSASTTRARSGTPTWRPGAACGYARAARCWRRSSWTGGPSPARSAGATIRSCTWSASSGVPRSQPSRRDGSSCFRPPPPAQASLDALPCLKQEFPDPCRPHRRTNRPWSGSYFAGSVGGAPVSVLRQYIEHLCGIARNAWATRSLPLSLVDGHCRGWRLCAKRARSIDTQSSSCSNWGTPRPERDTLRG